MKKISRICCYSAVMAIPIFLGGIAGAEDVEFMLTSRLATYDTRLANLEDRLGAAEEAVDYNGGESDYYCEPCQSSAGVVATAEALFFKYYRSDGMRFDGDNGDTASSSCQVSPRLTVGFESAGGLGVRARYWEYDQFFAADNVANGSGVSIDTYTIDLELFETFDLNHNWSMEVSGGVRYNEFTEMLLDVGRNAPHLSQFSGWGGIAAIELQRCVFGNVSIFTRLRGGILMDDKFQIEDVGDDIALLDTVVGVSELALGAEYRRCLSNGTVVFARGSYEWQKWYDYSAGFEDSDTSDDMSSPADVGFGGFAVALGLAR